MKYFFTGLVLLSLFTQNLSAATLRDLIQQRRAEKLSSISGTTEPSRLTIKPIELHYGADYRQTIDVYKPEHANNSAIIVMVHGGGWKYGDKNSVRVVQNKLSYFGSKGYVFASVNYRMLPEADPFIQALDVAKAIAYLQQIAPEYQADPNRLIAMGHSAGAHLVALISADPAIASSQGAKPWLGSVILDSCALDVPAIMNRKHARLYDEAFGYDKAFWLKTSPTAQLKSNAIPMMLVCSLKRPDHSCAQSHEFATRLNALGQSAPVLEQNLSHGEINENLGLPGDYTDSVGAFIATRLKAISK
jgi:acetyl esterase/lipase